MLFVHKLTAFSSEIVHTFYAWSLRFWIKIMAHRCTLAKKIEVSAEAPKLPEIQPWERVALVLPAKHNPYHTLGSGSLAPSHDHQKLVDVSFIVLVLVNIPLPQLVELLWVSRNRGMTNAQSKKMPRYDFVVEVTTSEKRLQMIDRVPTKNLFVLLCATGVP